MEQKLISTPALYISYYLKKNRMEYYDRMTEVRNKGNYEQWIKFFLRAVEETSIDAIKTIDQLNALRVENESIINNMGRSSKSTMQVFRYLESNPIIDIGKTAESLGLSFNTVSSAVQRLVTVGILSQTENISRNRTFVYEKYLNILKNGT